ncbi:hypothetical protein NG895_12845 [Aeoliella sp. ICT_H6.2]|uniref:Uncharacterized protein n=2 Tax=Aeoliella straminimaris TaxID=2954799 RepID=A0A9X2F9C5_9BACT|nr:hypothetical protein [Aeoliella straminimaris]
MARRPRSNSARRSRLFRSVDRAMEFKRSRTLRCEPLEERHLLAVDVFIHPVTGNITIMDQSAFSEGSEVQEDNNVTLSLGNFDPDGGEGAAAQDGLLITDPSGVNALSFGLLQVSDTEVFVPQNFDFQIGIGQNIQDVLTALIDIDLQSGDDDLTFSFDLDLVPVVTNYDIHGGDSSQFTDVLHMQGTAGVAESVIINPSSADPDVVEISGYAGVATQSQGFELIVYDAANLDDNLDVNVGNGSAAARVQAATYVGRDEVISGTLPRIQFDALNQFTLISSTADSTNTFVLEDLQGAENYLFDSRANETLIVEGSSDRDVLTASLDAAGDLQITGVVNTLNTSAMQVTDQLQVRTLSGNDQLIVDVEGTDVIRTPIFFDGGIGSDELQVIGTSTNGVQQITYTPGLQPDEGKLLYDTDLVEAGIDMQIDFDNLEPIIDLVPALILDVQGTGAANQITYGPALPGRGLVSIDGFETIAFENKTGLQISARGGDDTIVINNSDLPTGLESIQANGEDGNDTIRIEALPDASATSFVALAADGAGGNDTIDGSAILVDTPLNLIGGEGNDTLQGGASNDGLVGESGDDTIIDSPGDDIINAGLGNDTFVVRGTFLGELISVIQDAPSLVVADDYTLSVLGPTQGVKQVGKTNLALAPADAANSPTLERIIVEGLAGDDTIRVGHADEYGDLDANNGVPGQTIPYEVVGNGPNASDRLVVPDLGLGDLVIQRQGADQRSGSITVGSLAPVDYSEIEFVNVTPLDPITGGTGTDGAGRLVIFKADPFESNDTRPNATFLGSGPTINIDPTIDPGGIPEFGVPGDNDFYQFVAQETGTLDLQLYFEEIGTLENGRPGLPVNGDLVATVLDSDGVPVSIAMASDLDDPNGIKIGKRVVVPVVRNNTYYLRVEGRAGDQGVTGINVYNFTAITTAAPIPELVDLQADSDSGRNNTDDVTKIETPTFNIILDDDRIDEFMNIDMMPDTVDDDAPTAGFDYGVEVFNNATSIGFAFYTGVGNIWEFTATAGDLNEGDFNHIAAAVWIRDAADPAQLGRHLLSDSLQITLDTMTPPVSFGLPNGVNAEDGLDADSDSGVTTMPMTYADRVTSDTTPNLWGYAEANTIVRLYHDDNGNGIIDLLTDTFLGMTVAVPYDGNLAYPDGYWEIESVLDLNEIVGLPKDGLRQLLVTAEDVAGNPMPMNDQIEDGVDELDIFIDTQGPQVYDPAGATGAVHPTVDPEYDLFDPKPSENGFTPLTNQITIHVRDLPERSNADPNFLYEALKEDIAETLGNYTLVGDHVGHIGIIDVDVINDAPADGQVATATIIITFDQYLPDDRYTLTVSDNLVDPAGNNLDGESNATGPLDDPTFPTGDGVPGGEFVARFTIDSRPEIGTFVPSSITIDINGNFVWDPSNGQIGNDATNVDLTFTMDRPDVAPGGFATHDTVFAGKFVGGGFGGGGMVADRYFDQLAVYGYSVETVEHRWLIDLDSDGVADVYSAQPLLANFNVAGALPIAGNFDDNLANGDEIGLYYAGNWAFDFNHNFVIEAGEVVANTGLLGIPIVGDFDGNGIDDVGVFNNNIFNFAFSIGAFGAFGAFDSLQWGFSGVLERPVAADMDQDGVDDIGLFVPRNSSQPLRETAEWYFLLSDAFNTVLQEGTLSLLDHAFEPVPFGADLYAEFGDELSLPVVGNFDPPVAAQTSPNEQSVDDLPGDYDGSGTVDRSDYEVWKANFGLSGSGIAGDGNNDGNVDLADFTVWRNHLGQSLPTNTVASNNLPGDFDGNGTVDTGDYSLWKESFGQAGTGLAADGNGDGQVDLADFTVWRNHLGTSQPVAALAALSTTTEIVSAASSGTTTTDVATPKSDTTAEAKALALEGLVDDEKPSEGPTSYFADAGFSDGDDLLLLRTSKDEQESEWPEEALDEAIQSHSNELFGLAIDWGW